MSVQTLLHAVSNLGAAFLIAGFSTANAQTVGDTPVYGGILNITVPTEPVGLNSGINTTMFIGEVSSKIVEGLVAFDVNLNPVPALATKWEVSPDGLTLSFDLRQGVKWHDGKDFTAADVEFTLKEVWQKLHPFGKSAFGNVTKVDTPNPHKVILHLSAPAPYILNYINTYGAQVLPRHIYEGTDIVNNPYNTKPVGTGPFVFKEWVKGSHIRLEKNPNYWQKGQPFLDGIVFKFIPDSAARIVALKAGELDVVLGSALPVTSLQQFEDKSKYSINLIDGNYLATIAFLQFNVRNKPLSDVRVRQAIAHAINKQTLLKLVYLGYGKVATGPVPSSVSKYYSADTRQYAPDLERAAQLLDEAGYKTDKSGKRFKLRLIHDGAGGSPQNIRTAEFTKQALSKIGVEVELQGPDFATFLRYVFTEQDYDMMNSSMHRLPDPTLGVQRIFWTQNIRKGVPWTNGSGYSNPKLDAIMEQAAAEPDEVRRKALIKDWQQIVQEDVPLLELVEPVWYTVSTARFKKLALQADGLFASYADAWLEPKK
ncbi:ABC transporter substrate-binding protein [Betaproteobacteria bacterium]|nr:ABC transporter substrate-binding protein [Betaproteobacteria bacterium]GHU03378.1 ABC transporter substrate-binding protein [Betaproteobacteria bacterium]GHU11469.1 ABC transporter substrate-binding protein [Betaproteobacteria bacterium]GHU17841.1 ABC transporter substrate-binding protein [Betaproteobacteria bacterium]